MASPDDPPERAAPPRRRLRRVLRGGGWAAGFLCAFSAVLVADGWRAFGLAPEGARQARMEASPQWADGVFHNEQPLWNDMGGSMSAALSNDAMTSPTEPVPVVRSDGSLFDQPPPTGLRVTWMGHSSILLEIDGRRILFDPIFAGRASPYDWVGPDRWYEPPVALADLPALDAVVISHDHYDHLSLPTIEAMKDWDTRFITPLGVGAHLEYWGVPPECITELDWWESVELGGVEVVATPARHASGRQVLDQNRTLWAGYALLGPQHRVFYSGDTGLFSALQDIGDRFGPFDLTMIEIGAYHRAWPDWHMGPEQAVRAQGMLRGKLLLPVHWGLWNLALHAWTEPAERVLAAAEAAGIRLTLPRPGESIEPATVGPVVRWWPTIPWQTAEDHPIVATRNGDPDERM